MKKNPVGIIGLLICMVMTNVLLSQANPRGKATLEGEQLTVKYGRPSANGRDIMAMISPGTFWRMGADQATTLTTEKTLQFAKEIVPKGSYTLIAHYLEENNWQLIICKDTGPGFKPEDAVATAPFDLEEGQPHVEEMTIDLKKKGKQTLLVLSWGTSRLSAKFSENTSGD